MFIGGRRNRLEEYEEGKEAEAAASGFDENDVISLVVVDLLWLDGQWLLDVPLLERKRVLESIVPEEQLIRPGPYVRQPIASWIGSWRAQGFRAMTFKAANSRYRPGETSDEWTLAEMPRR
jgi:ATP-dependent DNA ligase